MPIKPGEDRRKTPDDFARLAEQAPTGLLGEFWGFLRHNKKWWLLPILVVLVLLGALVILSSPAVAPFIYTLF